MRIALFTLATASLCLTACNQTSVSHDKAYFTAHPQERAETLSACRNDSGRMGTDPDCANAIHSDADAEHERVFHSTPPAAAGVNNTGHM